MSVSESTLTMYATEQGLKCSQQNLGSCENENWAQTFDTLYAKTDILLKNCFLIYWF